MTYQAGFENSTGNTRYIRCLIGYIPHIHGFNFGIRDRCFYKTESDVIEEIQQIDANANAELCKNYFSIKLLRKAISLIIYFKYQRQSRFHTKGFHAKDIYPLDTDLKDSFSEIL